MKTHVIWIYPMWTSLCIESSHIWGTRRIVLFVSTTDVFYLCTFLTIKTFRSGRRPRGRIDTRPIGPARRHRDRRSIRTKWTDSITEHSSVCACSCEMMEILCWCCWMTKKTRLYDFRCLQVLLRKNLHSSVVPPFFEIIKTKTHKILMSPSCLCLSLFLI